ncbi:MAG: EAL domain-containing protein [Pseudomonadota bacterium]
MTDQPGSPTDPIDYILRRKSRSVLEQVRTALDTGNVALAFQPIVYATDIDRPAFHEGLIRLIDTNGEVIPARDFIDEVEMIELGRQIDTAALRCGIEALIEHPALRLSINMSARSIGYPEWMATLNKGLQEEPTVAERLILEITESSAISMPEIVSYFMADLHSRGISFALDDFGAGYTAFRFFREFQFDIVKIDGLFSRDIANNPDNQVLMGALIAIAEQFDMFTVAEEVERQEDLDYLQQSGIRCVQGYITGVPDLSPIWRVSPEKRRGYAS